MITQERLIEKITALPPHKLTEVEDFVDLISENRHQLSDEEKDAMIARYAAEFGGTKFDLDEDLQEAGLEAIAEDREVHN